MVVRLNELNSGNTLPKGLVRLTDLTSSSDLPASKTGYSMADRSEAQNWQPEEAKPLPGRDLPIIGPVLKGLDYIASNPVSEAIAEYTVPDAPYLDQPGTNARGAFLDRSGQQASTGVSKFIGQAAAPFFVPGSQLGTGTVATEASQAVLQRFAPRLQGIGRAAAREGLAGGAIGFGSEFAQGTGDVGDAALTGAFGLGLGAAGGAAIGGIASRLRRGQTPAAPFAISDQLRPTLPDEEIAQIADEGLNRLAPDTNPYVTDFMAQQPRLTQPEVQRPQMAVTPQLAEPPIPRTGNRQLIDNTMLGSERLTPEVRNRLENSNVRQYEPINNVDTVNSATLRIGRGVDEAESFALNGKGDMGTEQIATGFRLIDQFQKSGQIERAVTMVERLAERLTEAGRTVQAASIWNRLTPEGALLAAQRKVNKINAELPKGAEKVTISEKAASDIMDAAGAIQRAGGSKERATQVMDIMDRVRAGQQITDAERSTVSEFIKDAQQFVKPAKEKLQRDVRPPKEMSDKRVSDNVISFLEKQEQAAKERLRAKGIQLSSNPLDVWRDMAVVLASKMAKQSVKGVVKFSDLANEMVRDYGEQIRPHLNDIYSKAQEYLSVNSKRISQETISRAESVAERYLAKNESSLMPEDINLIRGMAQKVSGLSGDAQRLANQDLQAVLNSFEKSGIGRKLSAVQYISMLLNPTTQVRNIVGNELMYRLERLNRVVATPIDWANSMITGKDRTITFRKGPGLWDNFFSPSMDFIKGLREGAAAGARGVNPDGLTTAYDINGQAFRSKLNPLTYLEKTLGAVMKGFDYAAYTRAVQQRLRENAYLDALNRGIKGKDNIQQHIDKYLVNLDDNIAKVAQDYGKYITLQDDTNLSNALSSTKRKLNELSTFGRTKEFGVGNFVIPFAKTPANLLMRAIDYSPAGFVKVFSQTYDALRKPNTDLTRADVIQSVTRALLGTGLTGVGLWLADKGVLRGSSSGDVDVRNIEKQAGLSQYQLNASALQRMLGAMVTGNAQDIAAAAKIQPSDTLYQYEWAQPSAMPLAVGANVVQERKKTTNAIAQGKEKPENRIGQAYNVTTGALNTLFNTSVLQGLQRAFDLPPGEDNKIKAIGQNIIKQVPSMFVPSMLSKVNQLGDNAERETYSPKFTENLLNPARSRVPGLAQDLPQRVSTLGQPSTKENSFADVFLSPAQRSVYKPTEEARLVIDLLNATGDERVVPRTVPKYITGKDSNKTNKRVDLTGEQLVKYQRLVGEETAKGLGQLSPTLSDEKKVERVIDILNKAGEKARKEMRKDIGLK